MFENGGEIIILVLAVIVTWIVARAGAERRVRSERPVPSGLRASIDSLRDAGARSRRVSADVTVPAGRRQPEYDLIRVIPPDIAASA